MIQNFLRDPFWIDIENWPISWEIGGTSWFPFLESIHVISAAMVVGSILFVDLRLLGLAANRYPITVMTKELVPWSWVAFIVATFTGLGMFITRAASHVVNPAFQWKIALLVLAGFNMLYFHKRVYAGIQDWNTGTEIPAQVKVIGSASLILWSGVMLAGRWVGHII